ncbi:MAG TPA: hypothetical protein VLK22_02445 [Candidatus Udaeobacter sp.]|nr:hypothetical protein [Candidatus Udaeobacter sp.]
MANSNALIIFLLAVIVFMWGDAKPSVPPEPGQKRKLRQAAEQARAGRSDESNK